jgi:hypothetical protein
MTGMTGADGVTGLTGLTGMTGMTKDRTQYEKRRKFYFVFISCG